MTLKADYHLVLKHKANEPTSAEIDSSVHVWALRDENTHVYTVQLISPYPNIAKLRKADPKRPAMGTPPAYI